VTPISLLLKRLISIIFLFVFLFNVGGYYIVFWGVKVSSDNDLLKRLDANNYSANEVTILKIPISLPYPIYQAGYQRVNGGFEYQGDYYKMIKQKLENDTLFMACIKDVKATQIKNSLKDYSKLANDMPDSKQALSFLGKLFKDFGIHKAVEIRKSLQLFEQLNFAIVSLPILKKDYPLEVPPPEGML